MAELRLSAWGIKNPIPVSLIFIAAVIAGLFAYTLLPIKQFPNITFPAVVVTVTESGAASGDMNTQITRPIEDSVASLSGVHSIQSVVQQGVSTTVVEFELNEDLQKVNDEVRQKVDQTRAVLPRDIDPPIVQRLEIADTPIITYAVSDAKMSPAQLSWFIDDTISRTLQAQPGVAQISRVGGVDREINIIADPDRMAAQGLTADALNADLGVFSADFPGGRLAIGGREQNVRVLGAANTVQRLRNLTIPTAGGRFIKLSDIADVGDGAAEERSFARLNNQPVIGFQVLKTNDASEVKTESNVIDALKRLKAQYPDVVITKIFSTVDNTRESFGATLHTMLEGMALAALVVFLFLRDWRSTGIVAIAMPVSLIPTFAAMAVLGFSLNMVTLLALTLVIGILVDDAIVEIENIQKRVQAGARPYRAAMEGADQIGLAVVATTAAIVVVFAPVSFMGDLPGQFFKEFGITVVVAVLFSLLVARLLTPLLAAYFLAPEAEPHPRKPLPEFYSRALSWVLAHRYATCALGGAIFVLSLVLTVFLPTGVNPPNNPNYMFVGVQGPPGATAADMERISRQVTDLLRKQPETDLVFSQIGSTSGEGFGGGGSGDLSSGTVAVVLKPNRSSSVTQIEDRVRDALLTIPDARVSFQGGGFNASDVQILLTSADPALLERAGEELQREMRTVKSVADPRPSHPPTGPEIAIRPKPDQASRLGVTVASIASIARIATLGDIDANVPKLTEGERRIPIRVRLPSAARTNIDTIRNLQVPTAFGGTTSLQSVADVDFQAGPATIYRYARQRDLAVDADLTRGAQLGQALKEINNLPIMKAIKANKNGGASNSPWAGVEQASLGQQQQYEELYSSLGLAFFAGVSMIFGVLVLLFRSFFKPITILSALPLALGGAILALIAMRMSISLPSLIGLLMLLGIAAKNSILLVEYAIERQRAGVAQREAIIEACRERARPVVMTTVAMACGMLPTALGIGAGSEFRQPMAVAVIGGLISSTILSLVIVPVVYEIIDDLEHWLEPRLSKMITPAEAPPEPAPETAAE